MAARRHLPGALLAGLLVAGAGASAARAAEAPAAPGPSREAAGEAQEIARVLKPGPLPGPVTIAEERTVGATFHPGGLAWLAWTAAVGAAVAALGLLFLFKLKSGKSEAKR